MSEINEIIKRSFNEKGQLTIPAKYRDEYDTREFFVENKGDRIVLHPKN